MFTDDTTGMPTHTLHSLMRARASLSQRSGLGHMLVSFEEQHSLSPKGYPAAHTHVLFHFGKESGNAPLESEGRERKLFKSSFGTQTMNSLPAKAEARMKMVP